MRAIAVLFLALPCVAGCTAVRQVTALHRVEFHLHGIADPRVAGVQISGLRSFEDLSLLDVGWVSLAIAAEDVPLDLTIHVVGRNPETNSVKARLIGLDWVYIVDGRELVSGSMTEGYEFPPGELVDLPLRFTLNLAEYFGTDERNLVDVALSLSRQRKSTHTVTLRLLPEIDTPIGRMRFPTPLDLDLSTGSPWWFSGALAPRGDSTQSLNSR